MHGTNMRTIPVSMTLLDSCQTPAAPLPMIQFSPSKAPNSAACWFRWMVTAAAIAVAAAAAARRRCYRWAEDTC